MTESTTYFGIILIALAAVAYFLLRRPLQLTPELTKQTKQAPTWFSPLISNPFRRKRITQIKIKHQQKIREAEQQFFYQEFGSEIPKKLHPLFNKLHQITWKHKLQAAPSQKIPKSWLGRLNFLNKNHKQSAFNPPDFTNKTQNYLTIEKLRNFSQKNK